MDEVFFESKTGKTIILDLDECLIHSYYDRDKKYDFSFYLTNGRKKEYFYVKKRPKLDEFLRFCHIYFDHIIVWSAGVYEYVHELVNYIFTEYNPDLILTRNDIIYEDKYDYHKPISVVLEKIKSDIGIKLDMRDILFLDDKQDNFRSNLENGIKIKPFEGKHDKKLLQLKNWLLQDHIINSIDIRKLNKKEIWYNHEDRDLVFESDLY